MKDSVTDVVVFHTRNPRYGSVEVKFRDVEAARRNSTKELRTLEWVLYPTYLGKGMARLRVVRVLIESDPELLSAATLERASENTEIIQISRNHQVYWWIHDIELELVINIEALQNILQ